ncbi:MAG: KUP/HAK/KT family potassium transporter [Nocardioides sp.]
MTARGRSGAPVLLVGALGVVFGDIGTSPLYAMRTVLHDAGGTDTLTVYGMTSTVIWSLVVVVTTLYVGLLLRADNEGEGGLLALVGLLRRTTEARRTRTLVTFVAMAGAAMFLGDCVITPAISVLSAAEGLEVASPLLKVVVLPVALTLLVGVFVLQRVGSGRIGRFYGPVMVVWFALLAAGGVGSLVRDPGALEALSPTWAVRFFVADPATAFLSLGAVVLVVTGAEALYADLGHFGRPAISRAWLWVVLPALVTAYLGEAAAVVRDPSAASEPFYAVVPGWATVPVLVVATAATVIASEAAIAGAFTVLHQAGGLGLFPYLRTRHPSAEEGGQIYVPAANWALAAAVLAMVLLFRSSDRLASAYGVAVSATILTTTFLWLTLQRARSGRLTARAALGMLCGVAVLAFLVATGPKLLSGGWAPTGLGAVLFVVMWTWTSGQARLRAVRRAERVSPRDLVRDVPRTPGTGVFLTPDCDLAPSGLVALVETGQTLPERVVLLSWRVEDTPRAPAHATRVDVRAHDELLSVDVVLGYRERLEVGEVLRHAREREPDLLADLDPEDAFYVVSEPIPRLGRSGEMARWRQRLFLLLDRLATDRVDQMELPRGRTIVVGREFSL